LDLLYLRTFVVVVATGNFTRAASQLGYSQASVTHHIQVLEKTLGATLLDRSRFSKATVTVAGRRVLGYAERLLSLAAEAKNSVISA
jgi:DNA-binding transcriptional LysR family regulator